MQFAMNASPAPRGRSGSVAFCNCSKQKSSISLDAAEAEVTLINDKKMDPTSTHSVFKTLCFLRVVVGFSFHHDASTTIIHLTAAVDVHRGGKRLIGQGHGFSLLSSVHC